MCKRFEDFNEEAKKYRTILVNYREKGEIFIDPNFHPTAKIPERVVSFDDSTTEWLRIDEVYNVPLFKKELIHYDFVQQGTLADCYLLSLISYLSQHPSLVPRLFDMKANIYLGKENDTINIKCGAVVIYFYAFGQRTPVLIDTLIPFSKGTRTPLFSHPSDTSKSPWFCLVEKAYAKLMESYTELAGGSFAQAIYSIFGFSSSLKNFSTFKTPEKASKMSPFDRILKYEQQGAIIGACIHPEKLQGVTEEELTNKGLITVHSYLLLKTKQYGGRNFLCLRNPWGEHEWNGDWSDNSNLWTSDMKNGVGMKASEDGTFWMIDSDFFKYFSEIDVGQRISPYWHSRHFFYPLNPGAHDDSSIPTEEAFNLSLPRFAFQVTDKFDSCKKCHLRIICERRHKLLDSSGNYNDAPPPFCVELKSRHLVTVRLFQLSGPSHIITFPYYVNNGDEMLVIQLRRLARTDMMEDCCVKIFCELDFKLIDVNKPEAFIEEDAKLNSILDAADDDQKVEKNRTVHSQNLNRPSQNSQNRTKPSEQQSSGVNSIQPPSKQIQNQTEQKQTKPSQSLSIQNQTNEKTTHNQNKTNEKKTQIQNHIKNEKIPSKIQTPKNEKQNQSPSKMRQQTGTSQTTRTSRIRPKLKQDERNIIAKTPSFKPKNNTNITDSSPISKAKPKSSLTPVKHIEKQTIPEQINHKVPKPKPAKTIDLNDKSIRKMYNSISNNVYKSYLS